MIRNLLIFNTKMVIGIDAANLRGGGGRTHLIELLRAASPHEYGFDQVIVWGARATLALIDDRPWLKKVSPSALEKGFMSRALWQRRELSKEAIALSCDLLFVPGSSYAGSYRPVVTMSQNMLPFQWTELRRYGLSIATLKLILLRWIQGYTFRHADGVIFLTEFARKQVQSVIGRMSGVVATIPHGLSTRFIQSPRPQQLISAFSDIKPYRVLYVSIVDQYKHQWHVVEAVRTLRKRTGWPIVLDLVGPAYPPALRRLNFVLNRCDPEHVWAQYLGGIPFEELHAVYHRADLGLFASSCENMPNILLETMGAGLPIACSDCGPMPEVLGDAGVYFDPISVESIAAALEKLIGSPELREISASSSYARALGFRWDQCADQTFHFLADVASSGEA